MSFLRKTHAAGHGQGSVYWTVRCPDTSTWAHFYESPLRWSNVDGCHVDAVTGWAGCCSPHGRWSGPPSELSSFPHSPLSCAYPLPLYSCDGHCGIVHDIDGVERLNGVSRLCNSYSRQLWRTARYYGLSQSLWSISHIRIENVSNSKSQMSHCTNSKTSRCPCKSHFLSQNPLFSKVNICRTELVSAIRMTKRVILFG